MSLRDEAEAVLVAWDAYERANGRTAVIDFDCRPVRPAASPAEGRLVVLDELRALHAKAVDAEDGPVSTRLTADLAYLGALLGEHRPLDEYVRATQGCPALGWPSSWVEARGEVAREHLEASGVRWGRDTENDLADLEGRLEVEAVGAAIRLAADEFEPVVRAATGTDAPFALAVEAVDVDAYWGYWLDGAGHNARLRINTRTAKFTAVRARQFALHEVLGHALQSASFTAAAAAADVPWVRLLSVHAPQQVLLEGLAQALPLLVVPTERPLALRVRLDRYLQLVRAELHLALGTGTPAGECADLARRRVPFWTDSAIASMLSDRGGDPLLRSYLWSYSAGIDWFVCLADSGSPDVIQEVLRAAYRAPLTPNQLTALWPAGPRIGGSGAVRVRDPALP